MKFKVVRASLGLEVGGIYSGSIVILGASSDSTDPGAHIQIVVYNDLGKWHAYHRSHFVPA